LLAFDSSVVAVTPQLVIIKRAEAKDRVNVNYIKCDILSVIEDSVYKSVIIHLLAYFSA